MKINQPKFNNHDSVYYVELPSVERHNDLQINGQVIKFIIQEVLYYENKWWYRCKKSGRVCIKDQETVCFEEEDLYGYLELSKAREKLFDYVNSWLKEYKGIGIDIGTGSIDKDDS